MYQQREKAFGAARHDGSHHQAAAVHGLIYALPLSTLLWVVIIAMVIVRG